MGRSRYIEDKDGNEALVDATTDALKVQAQAGTAEIGKVKVTDGTNVLDLVVQGISGVSILQGVLVYGSRTAGTQARLIPVAPASDADASKGANVVPVTPMTRESEEGARTHTNDACFVVSYEVTGVDVKTGYVLIDLSNAIKYPHTEVNEIHVDWLSLSMLGDVSVEGHVHIGFLSHVDATKGTLEAFVCKPADKSARTAFVSRQYNPSAVRCKDGAMLAGGGMHITNETTFQNDVAIAGTFAAVIPAVGDLVMLIDWVAGTFDTVSVAIGYHTI